MPAIIRSRGHDDHLVGPVPASRAGVSPRILTRLRGW